MNKLWKTGAASALLVLAAGCGSGGGSSDGGNDNAGNMDGDPQQPPANNQPVVSGRVLVPMQQSARSDADDNLLAGAGDWLITPANAQMADNGLAPINPESISISIFNESSNQYEPVQIDADIAAQAISIGPDDGLNAGEYEIDFNLLVGEGMPEITAALAADCVYLATLNIDGETVELRTPASAIEIDITPLTEFVSRTLETEADFTDIDIDELNDVLASVNAAPVSDDADIEEIIAQLRDTVGENISQELASARQPAAAPAQRDAVAGEYNIIARNIEVFAEEDGFFGNVGFYELDGQLQLNSSNDELQASVVDFTQIKFEHGASSGGFDELEFERDPPESEGPLEARLSADGQLFIDFPANLDVEQNEAEGEAGQLLRLRPIGDSGVFVAAPGGRFTEYGANNGQADFGDVRGRGLDRDLVVAMRRPAESVTPPVSGVYGFAGFRFELNEEGDSFQDSLLMRLDLGATTGQITSEFEVDHDDGGDLFFHTETDSSLSSVSLTTDNEGGAQLSAIFEQEPSATTFDGLVSGDGNLLVLKRFQCGDEMEDELPCAEDEELFFAETNSLYGVRLDTDGTPPDLSGRSYRLHLREYGYEDGGASLLLGMDNAVLAFPENFTGSQAVTASNVRNEEGFREQDSGPLEIGFSPPRFDDNGDPVAAETVSSSSVSYGSDGEIEIVFDDETTLRGYVAADGNAIMLSGITAKGCQVFVDEEEDGDDEAGRTTQTCDEAAVVSGIAAALP